MHLSLMCSLVTKQQHQITSLKSAISKLSLNYTGTLIWKITDYAAKMSEAKAKEGMELVSPPFYTSQYGYKLQVRITIRYNIVKLHFTQYLAIVMLIDFENFLANVQLKLKNYQIYPIGFNFLKRERHRRR